MRLERCHPKVFGRTLVKYGSWHNLIKMKVFRALGLLLLIWGMQLVAGDVSRSFGDALVATFGAVERAAEVSTLELDTLR